MVFTREVFCEIICRIVFCWFPTNFKHCLRDFVPQPVVAHVPRFGALLGYIVFYERCRSGIVRLNGSGWLGMAKGDEEMPYWDRHLRIVEDAGDFRFSGRRDNMPESSTFY